MSSFTHAQPRRMTPVAMLCLLCLYHGPSAVSPNRKKGNSYLRSAKINNIIVGLPIYCLCVFHVASFFSEISCCKPIKIIAVVTKPVTGFRKYFCTSTAVTVTSCAGQCAAPTPLCKLNCLYQIQCKCKEIVFLSSFIN